jgi:cyclophilin family peptidyl-prolyl cis-trans isomerase
MRTPATALRALTAILLIVALGACKKDPAPSAAPATEPGKAAPAPAAEAIAGKIVELTTSLGAIRIELDRAKAPQSAANFLRYVKDGFYAGTIFHRVISEFMIQGGGFTEDFTKKPTRDPVPNEADNGLKNTRGTVAMARTSDPQSATAQFFINVVDNASLDHTSKTPSGWGYAVFGKVVAGMDVVDKIRATPTGAGGPFTQDCPQTAVVIQSAKIIE